MRKNSIKNIRINEEVLRELSDIIRNKVKDPRIAPVTSVTGVEVAPDLKTCKIWISVLGDEEAEKKTMEGLNSSKNFIRHELARTVNLRNTPELFFHLDTSIAYGVHMSKMIDKVNHGLKVSDLDKADKKED
ncbi:MAG: 30S ribosome-binding factor RbfA [Lachnospiraceae bacterium]|nr:30S ribosome-binding factor RbfA [Lachnospiraceae bacterium]